MDHRTHHSRSIPLRVATPSRHGSAPQGLHDIFDQYAAFIELVGPTSNGADVILLDTSGLPDSGVPVASAVVAGGHRPVLVLSEDSDERVLLRMLRAGVGGFVVKPRDDRRLVEDLVAVASGDLVVDPGAAQRAAVLAARLLDLDRPPAELLGLSHREVEVLERLAEGATARQIGNDLFVSHETVRSHLKRIYRKLGVHDRSAAISRAREEGVLPAA